MILTQPFHTPAAAVDYFNAPANVTLRLVSVLPPTQGGTDYMAIYEERGPVIAHLDPLRLRLLEERVLTLWQLDAPAKQSLKFPPSIRDTNLVPLAIVTNKLGHLAAFKEMDTPARTQWIKENLAAVGCAYISAEEARARHDCGAELIRIDE